MTSDSRDTPQPSWNAWWHVLTVNSWTPCAIRAACTTPCACFRLCRCLSLVRGYRDTGTACIAPRTCSSGRTIAACTGEHPRCAGHPAPGHSEHDAAGPTDVHRQPWLLAPDPILNAPCGARFPAPNPQAWSQPQLPRFRESSARQHNLRVLQPRAPGLGSGIAETYHHSRQSLIVYMVADVCRRRDASGSIAAVSPSHSSTNAWAASGFPARLSSTA